MAIKPFLSLLIEVSFLGDNLYRPTKQYSKMRPKILITNQNIANQKTLVLLGNNFFGPRSLIVLLSKEHDGTLKVPKRTEKPFMKRNRITMSSHKSP